MSQVLSSSNTLITPQSVQPKAQTGQEHPLDYLGVKEVENMTHGARACVRVRGLDLDDPLVFLVEAPCTFQNAGDDLVLRARIIPRRVHPGAPSETGALRGPRRRL